MTDIRIYGLHAVKALLTSNVRKTTCLYISDKRQDKRLQALLDLALEKKIPIETLTQTEFELRFKETRHQGVIAHAKALSDYREQDLAYLLDKAKNPPLVLILDGITDPHNLGACLRTADAAGVDFVIISKDKSAPVTGVVAKVASGAVESIPIVRVTNLVRAINLLKEAGVWVYGAAGEAPSSIYALDCKIPLALVMGSEGDGLRRLTREHCDGLFSLPMQGQVESLNVSVATAVSLYEVLRQRL